MNVSHFPDSDRNIWKYIQKLRSFEKFEMSLFKKKKKIDIYIQDIVPLYRFYDTGIINSSYFCCIYITLKFWKLMKFFN